MLVSLENVRRTINKSSGVLYAQPMRSKGLCVA